jgi:SAM-dependent methyltransferase
MTDIHHAAAIGFAAKAATYASGRPEYPDSILPWLTASLGLGSAKTALDLGAGTGKFTRLLQATGANVIAIEPVGDMRAELTARLPGVDARTGTATAIPADDASIDLVACAQAFHWFANDHALAEIKRVLKPGGSLLLVWNVRDHSVGWVRSLTDIIAPYEGDAPRYHTGRWRDVFPADGFGPLGETIFAHEHSGPPETVIVDRFMSVSFIAALPETEQAIVRAKLRAVIAATPDMAGAQQVTFPYATHVFVVPKIG